MSDTETMIFRIVGNLAVCDVAKVERWFKQDLSAEDQNNNIVYSTEVEVEHGNVRQWEAVHRDLREVARQLGFKKLLSAEPCPKETMIFQIVGNLKISDTAHVERLFKDDLADNPGGIGVVHSVEIDVDLGDVKQWDAIHQNLKNVARQLGFKKLLNADPCPDTQQAIQRSNKLRRISTEAA
ncbi:hypothetical protein KKG46_03320 [Patescibacteria group bacterium]|nr:hypothetical protein [Patescibacteria group bacterium]